MNFLSFIAEAGVFDRANGKSKIENAREAKLWDVLIFASEKKGYERAMAKYYKRQHNS